MNQARSFEARRAPLFILVGGGRELPLDRGTYTVGRAADCEISVPDDPKMSRHHARLTVHEREVSVEDLGSTNGTRVGSQRVSAPVRIGPGAKLSIGSQEFELKAGATPTARMSRRTAPEVPQAFADDEPEPADSELPTDKLTVFDTVTLDVDRLVRAGKIARAVGLLEPCFRTVLEEARATGRVDADVVHKGAELGFNMAEITGDGVWIEWVLEMHTRGGHLLSEERVGVLERIAAGVSEVSTEALDAYFDFVRREAPRLGPPELILATRAEAAMRRMVAHTETIPGQVPASSS